MTRKLSPLAVAALTGALGLGTTLVWADSNPEHVQNREPMSTEQFPGIADQPQINNNWSAAPAHEMSSPNIKEVQEALKEKGYDPGVIDGMLNTETQAAIQSFQRSSGLEATGQLDDQTMAKLGVKEHAPVPSSAGYERSSAEPEGRSANFERSVDSEPTSTNSVESSPSS